MEKNSENTEKIKETEQEIIEKFQKLQLEKQRNCEREINEVLQKYGFTLDLAYQIILKPLK